MYYWSTDTTEVDLLLSRDNSFIAIEFKASRRLRPEHLKALRSIKELKGVTRRIVVYEGERTFIDDEGLELIPVGMFLDILARGLK